MVLAYLLGSIPSAVWIGRRFYNIDVREHGSKNAGSTNTLRVLGRKAALPVFILDILKGFIAVSLFGLLSYDSNISDVWIVNFSIIAVFIAVLGHIFPIFADFRGGKGVATLVGAVTGIFPSVVLPVFGVWLLLLIIFHYVSLASMVAGCCFPIFTLLSPAASESLAFVIFAFCVAGLLIWTHRTNIERLKNGTESKIYLCKPKEKGEQS